MKVLTGRVKKWIAAVAFLMLLTALSVLGAYAADVYVSNSKIGTVANGVECQIQLTAQSGKSLPTSSSGYALLYEKDNFSTTVPSTYSGGVITIAAADVKGSIYLYVSNVASYNVISVPKTTTTTTDGGTVIPEPSTGDVSVVGSYVVYQTLRAVVPSDAGEVKYQWYRSTSTTRRAISGATGATYTLTKDDVGKIIDVEVQGTKFGQKTSNGAEVQKLVSTIPTQNDVKITHATKTGTSTGSIIANTTTRTLQYYDKLTSTWKNLPYRSCKAGEYQIRYAETDDTQNSDYILVKVLEPLTSPVAADISITHNTVAGGSAGALVPTSTGKMEYLLNGQWVALPARGLRAGEYSVRFAQTENNLASAETKFYVKEPTSLRLSLTDLTVTNNTTNGGSGGAIRAGTSAKGTIEVYVGDTWKKGPVTGLKAGTYQVRYAETNTTFASEAISVTVKEPAPTPTGFVRKDVSVYGGRDGELTGLRTDWQYSFDKSIWTDCPSTKLSGLATGMVYLRAKATATLTESAVASIYIRQPEQTPVAEINYVNETLKNLKAKDTYTINGTAYTASATGTIQIPESLIGTTITLIKKGNDSTTTNSAPQTIALAVRPAKPGSTSLVAKTDRTITVVAADGLEYSVDGKNYYSSDTREYVFKNLTANREYVVYTRKKAVEGKSFASEPATFTVKTKKSSAYAVSPKATVITDITDKTITMEVVAGQEYNISGEWITPTGSTYTWKNLKEKTVYTIQTRTRETEDTMYSSSLSARVTTYTKLTIASYTIDYLKGGLVGLASGEYSVNGFEKITVGSDGILHLEKYFGRTVSIVRLGSDLAKTSDSDATRVSLNSPVAAPPQSILPRDSIRASIDSLTILQSKTNVVYAILNAEMNPVTEEKSGNGGALVFGGLKDGTLYYVQASYAATSTTPHSNGFFTMAVSTMSFEATPTASVDTVNRLITGLLSETDYKVGDRLYRTNSAGTIAVEDAWIGQTISIIKLGNNTTTVDSLSQSLVLPARNMLYLSATTVPVTYRGAKNGAIRGLNSGLAYSADGGKTWKAVEGSYLEGLAAGDYLIRRQATPGVSFESVPQTVTVGMDVPVADAIERLSETLNKEYEDRQNSKRYSEEQLAQIRSIIDNGMKNVYDTLNSVSEVEAAGDEILKKIEKVKCSNVPTADGKLVGDDITSNGSLTYENDSDVIWANIKSSKGMSPTMQFKIDKLGLTDTRVLRNLVEAAIAQKSVIPCDGSTAAQVQEMLRNVELKMGLSITLSDGGQALTEFDGPYTVTILLPKELVGLDMLNVIAVDSQNNIELHPAQVVGPYLVFETNHFSTYGIIAKDEVMQAKSDALGFINDVFNKLNPKDYTEESWNQIRMAMELSISNVQSADTVKQVEKALNDYTTILDSITPKAHLEWLWILLGVLGFLIGLAVACYLVWRVRYYDEESLIKSEFHVCRTRIELMVCAKEGYALEGWYYDSACTKRVEDDLVMPWNGIKLYAKWRPDPTKRFGGMLSAQSEEKSATPMLTPGSVEEKAPEQTEQSEQSVENAADTANEEINTENVSDEANETEADDDLELLETLSEADDTADLSDYEKLEGVDNADNADADDAVEKESDADESDETEDADAADDSADGEVGEEGAEDVPNDPRKSRMYSTWLAMGDDGDADDGEDENDGEEDNRDEDEDELFTDEKTGERYHIRFNISYRARLTDLSDEVKQYYTELKNEILSYRGVKSRMSWRTESFRRGRVTLAKFAVRNKELCVYLALDPEQYMDTRFVFESVRDVKLYENVPMLVYIRNELAAKKAKDLIADVMAREAIAKEATEEGEAGIEPTSYEYLNADSSTNARLRAGLLKIYADGPDAAVSASRVAAATIHYLSCPEITAEDAERDVSDEMLRAAVGKLERPGMFEEETGTVSIEQISKKFYQGDEVTPEKLVEQGLLGEDRNYVRIVGSGRLDKKLIIHAHAFDKTAAKMILLTGGEINIICD